MNQSYQTNLSYNGATAIAMPMQPSILQPSLLEQKLYEVIDSIAQKGKEGIVGSLNYLDRLVTAAATAVDYYQTGIASYIQERGLLLFSKRGRELKKQVTRKELDKKRAEKERRVKNPSGGSRYARKHGSATGPTY